MKSSVLNGETGGTDFVQRQYTEAELIYLEKAIIQEHFQNGKQFDINPVSTTDPTLLLRQYQS